MRGAIEDDLADGEGYAAPFALMMREVKAECLIVEMRDPKALERRVLLGEASREERTRRSEAIELQREFGTLIPHPDRVADGRASNDANRVGFGGDIVRFGWRCGRR